MADCGPLAAVGDLIPSANDSGSKIGKNAPRSTPPEKTLIWIVTKGIYYPFPIETFPASYKPLTNLYTQNSKTLDTMSSRYLGQFHWYRSPGVAPHPGARTKR